MLYEVRMTTCSRNQHIVGGRVGLLIYVRMNIDYSQTVSSLPLLAQVQLVGLASIISWNSLSSTLALPSIVKSKPVEVLRRLQLGT